MLQLEESLEQIISMVLQTTSNACTHQIPFPKSQHRSSKSFLCLSTRGKVQFLFNYITMNKITHVYSSS